MPGWLKSLVAASSLALAAWPAFAADLAEYQVKAAFVYNFARYVEWPPETLGGKDNPFTICIIGQDPFGTAFSSVEGRVVSGRPLRVRRDVRSEEAVGCQIAFIADSEERRFQSDLRALGSTAVLTISDIEGFAEAGGAIGLFVADNRLQFDANFATLQRANLKASSQALRLARRVYGMKR
jgi:hypothetical protein